jgi:triosephosphate isomerase (TIM)
MIVINFKNYVHGDKAVGLAKKVQKYCRGAIVCASSVDISYIRKATNLKIYAQHVDYLEGGRGTGFTSIDAIESSGGTGSLLNHSEHQLKFKTIKRTVELAKKRGVKVILCSKSIGQSKKFMKLKPWAIAYEDPKLVGSGKSITAYRADVVRKFASVLGGSGVVPLCGAGINSVQDVKSAKQLGCKGVLIASAIAKVKNPDKLLKEISKI